MVWLIGTYSPAGCVCVSVQHWFAVTKSLGMMGTTEDQYFSLDTR